MPRSQTPKPASTICLQTSNKGAVRAFRTALWQIMPRRAYRRGRGKDVSPSCEREVVLIGQKVIARFSSKGVQGILRFFGYDSTICTLVDFREGACHASQSSPLGISLNAI